MSELDILKAGRALIAKGFCRGTFAMDAQGVEVPPTHPDACAWCSVGALKKAGAPESLEVSKAARELLEEAMGGVLVEYFNDDRKNSYQSILKAWDCAIALGEARIQRQVNVEE